MATASRKLLGVFLSFVLALSMVPVMALPAFADEVVTSQIGTTTWTLQNGVLTITPTNGISGQLPATSYDQYEGPSGYSKEQGWNDSYAHAVKIAFSGNITFNKVSRGAFSDFENLEALQMRENAVVKLQQSTNLDAMFYKCNKLTDIAALAEWDTTGLAVTSDMFQYCTTLVDTSALGCWDMSNVTDVSGMFGYCSSLSSISALGGWDTSNITSMALMFQCCYSLSDVSALTAWDVSNVTTMSEMFPSCTSLSDISPLANWNTAKVASTYLMFYNCPVTKMAFGSKWKSLNLDLQTPSEGEMTGSWISPDAQNKGPLTTSQLVNGWDPSTMSGTWIAEGSDWPMVASPYLSGSIILPAALSISPTSTTLASKGATRQLSATVSPSNATNKAVTWSSSSISIATVSSTGLVTAVANGTATITARTSNGKTATCKVTVSIPVQPTGVTLNPTSASFTAKGATRQLVATVSPSNATSKSVTWSSSNSAVATVSSTGLVTAVANGSATITARTSNGKTATCYVSVNIPVLPTGVSINQKAFKFTKKADARSLTATVYPTNATNKAVTWSSSNTAIAKVSSTGKVTTPGTKNGYTYITAKTANGKTAKVKVTVKIVYPTKISITTKAFTLAKKGATKTVAYKLSGSGITDKTVTWTSSNAKVATVSTSGKVTAVANGTATIKAKTANGKTASVKATVKIPVVKVTSVSLSATSATLKSKGAIKQLTATVKPTNATNKKVTWTTSNSKVATVSSSGKVTAVANGTATITAKTSDGGKTAKCKVTVSIPKTLTEEERLAQDIFAAYNSYRASKGLKKATWDDTFASYAVSSAKKNAAKGRNLTHYLGIPSSLRAPNPNTNKTKYYCSDILQYSTWKQTGTEAVTAWKGSNGHRKMMQCTTTTKAGVGVYKSGGIWYYAIVYNFKGTNQGGN